MNEGESVEFTIVLSSVSDSEVTVGFSTRDSSAVGKFQDQKCDVRDRIKTCIYFYQQQVLTTLP